MNYVKLKDSIGLLLKDMYGLTTSNNSTNPNNDIDIAAGRCMDSTGTYYMILENTITKRLDANWEAGTDKGGLFAGTKAADTTYHLFLIFNPETKTVDVGWDTSVTADNRPEGYIYYRRIWSNKTDSSGNITGYIQIGKKCFWKTPVQNPTINIPGNGLSNIITLNGAITGVDTLALVQGVGFIDSAYEQIALKSIYNSDYSTTKYNATWNVNDPTGETIHAGNKLILVNTNGQIACRISTAWWGELYISVDWYEDITL